MLGERADITRAAEIAAETAQAEAIANPQNGHAWFNLGSSLTRLGRYAEAATAYEQATRVGVPWRMTLYQFGIFETYFNLGRYSDVTALVNANLNNGGEYVEETYYWQGKVLAAQGQTTEAATSFRRALQHNPRFTLAQDALDALPA
jgi:tetratricopeptide (TPR) repeat protein